jgi:hypothetical protein
MLSYLPSSTWPFNMFPHFKKFLLGAISRKELHLTSLTLAVLIPFGLTNFSPKKKVYISIPVVSIDLSLSWI